jgi:hypothetical protein
MPSLYLITVTAMLLVLAPAGERAPRQISERELRAAEEEGAEFVKAQTVEMDFVIVRSTTNYEEARRIATEAARRLEIPLNLRDLSPHPPGGLTFPKKDCEDSAFDYPCYLARGRADDGFYASIEYSSAYSGFKPGLYIVIVASEAKDGPIVKRAMKAAKRRFKDAYTRRTGVYMGCIH